MVTPWGARRFLSWTIIVLFTVGSVMTLGKVNRAGTESLGDWGWMMPMGLILISTGFILAVLLVLHPPPSSETVPVDPQGVLDARYVRGELSRDEYLRMREDLGGARGP